MAEEREIEVAELGLACRSSDLQRKRDQDTSIFERKRTGTVITWTMWLRLPLTQLQACF